MGEPGNALQAGLVGAR